MSAEAPAERGVCRLCGSSLSTTVVDLGMSPLCESYLTREQLDRVEPFYPLHLKMCGACLLVQLEAYVPPETIFSEYAYFSSYSTSWLAHARQYVDMIVDRLALDAGRRVVEIGSNDGYLLQYFRPHGIPAIGVEPAWNVAAAALARGVPTRVEFFGAATARQMAGEGLRADLIVANNVLAQVHALNDFVEGLAILLGPRGVATLECPHLSRLVQGNQFDTIYHEHFSYFSMHSAAAIFARHALTVFDVDELPMHGGSLRVWIRHEADASRPVSPRVADLLARERSEGITDGSYYAGFGERVQNTKRQLLRFLIDVKDRSGHVVAYGAPGKGNTLLNYCGIRGDLVDYSVDRNPYKQGRYLPGTHIPICAVERIADTRPDYLLVMPWNLKDEIMQQTACIRDWGGRHVVAIPELKVYG